jgi:DNA polymerase
MSLVAMLPEMEGVRPIIVWVPPMRAPKGLSQFEDQEFIGQWNVYGNLLLCMNLGTEMPELLQEAIEQRYTFIAHNALGFDALAMQKLVTDHPIEWFDTIFPARAAGFPGKLDRIGKQILGKGKDEGQMAMKMLTKARVVLGDLMYPIGTPYLWRDLIRYNIGDVVLLDKLFNKVRGFVEADFLPVHQKINERGIPIDVPFCNHLKTLYETHDAIVMKDVSKVSDGEITEENIRSIPQIQKWLKKNGIDLPSIERKQLDRFFTEPESFSDCEDETLSAVIHVLKLRQEVARTGKNKLVRMTDLVNSGGRVTDLHVYGGAHTLRFSSYGLQLHNFSRGLGVIDKKTLDYEKLCSVKTTYEDIVAESERMSSPTKTVTVAEVLSTITRPVIASKLGFNIADFAAIEARVLAWLCNDGRELDIYADPTKDNYKVMGSTIYGVPYEDVTKDQRFVGKTCVLGCGYGMSHVKFALTCLMQGINLEKAGTTARACVNAYRQSHPNVTVLWKLVGMAAEETINTRQPQYAAKCTFQMVDNDLHIVLPSGRPIVYRNAHMEERIPAYVQLFNMQPFKVPTVCFTHPHGYTATTYGGKLVENIDQAVSRDILVNRLTALDKDGFNVVFHVHDEIGDEGKNRIKKMLKVMTTVPDWAEGLPLAAEGYYSPRYTKQPYGGREEVKYLNGKEVTK